MSWDDDGTLADEHQLMPRPAFLGRGFTRTTAEPSPAAGAAFTKTFSNEYWRRLVAVTFTYTASSAVGNRYPFIQYLDASGDLMYQVTAAPVVTAGIGALVSADLGTTTVFPGASSLTVTNNATAVTAGQVIATLTLPQGNYSIAWEVVFSGTTGAAEVDNLNLEYAGAVIAPSVNGNSAGQQYLQPAVQLEVPAGGGSLTINAIANGTATARYNVTATATLIGSQVFSPRLPDLIMKSAYQVQISATGILAADQISGVVITSEHYSSSWADGTIRGDDERMVRRLREWLMGG